MQSRSQTQRGIALIVSLLLLVAITLLVVSAMRGTSMQERMAVNMNQREIARQVAEATVFYVSTQLPPAGNHVWYKATLPTPVAGETELWLQANNWGSTQISLNKQNYPAEFKVENMGSWTSREDPTCKVKENPLCERQTYRITARVKPQDGEAQLMLQAIWRL